MQTELRTAALTAIAGSSDVVERGFVTYSNEAKNQMIGVPMRLIETQGAVSEQVAAAMAEGALARSRAVVAVSVTGGRRTKGGIAVLPGHREGMVGCARPPRCGVESVEYAD